MSHISAGVEYGLHCLLYLTEPAPGVPEASVRDLAELQGVPIDYLAKLFTKLAKAGLVIADSRGDAKRGQTDARSARESLAEGSGGAHDGEGAAQLRDACREVARRQVCEPAP